VSASATVTISRAEYERLLAALEDAEDRATLAAARDREVLLGPEEARKDHLPVEAFERLLAGESPVAVWREHRRLSPADLARAASLTTSEIADIEAGLVQPAADVRVALADALDVPLEELSFSEPSETCPAPAAVEHGSEAPSVIVSEVDGHYRYRITRARDGFILTVRQRSKAGLFLAPTWRFPDERTARAALDALKAFHACWHAFLDRRPTETLEQRWAAAEQRLGALMAGAGLSSVTTGAETD
jgi:transcriptional regulator with XRE-family HTH domain